MSAPPYMKLFVADYLADTTHLTTREHGAYLLLLMAMWRAGGTLPADDRKLAAISKCSPKEWAEMRPTILEFFKRRGGQLGHKRVAAEIAKYEDISEKRSRARNGSRSEKPQKNNDHASAFVDQMDDNCGYNQNQSHSQKKTPLPPRGDGGLFGEADEAGGDPPDEVRTAFDLWNVTAKACGLPIAELLSDGRRKAIRKRLEIAGLAGWCRALAAVEASPLCRGQKPGRDGGDPWRADLDFVCQAKSFARLIEGYYGAGAEPPKPALPAGPPEDPWRKRLRMFVRDKSWNELDWGPRPGRPGCTVDPAILREFGIEPAKPQPVPEQAA